MSARNDWRVSVPEAASGEWRVERFTVDGLASQMGSMFSTGRFVPEGTYTRLMRGGCVVMSDTPDEQRDHLFATFEMRARGGRVLLGGLGLGCVLQEALRAENVTHVDVVERSKDVVSLVGPHYEAMAREHGKTLVIHEADLFEVKWPTGTRWSVAWFDIWDHLTGDNMPEYARLLRSYGRRADWRGCWGKAWLEAHRSRWDW